MRGTDRDRAAVGGEGDTDVPLLSFHLRLLDICSSVSPPDIQRPTVGNLFCVRPHPPFHGLRGRFEYCTRENGALGPETQLFPPPSDQEMHSSTPFPVLKHGAPLGSGPVSITFAGEPLAPCPSLALSLVALVIYRTPSSAVKCAHNLHLLLDWTTHTHP